MVVSNPKTILLVEDFDDIRDAISMLIELHGHRVVEATDGHEALEMAMGHRPDLILMDIAMPAFDGITAARKIRSYPELANIKMIAISAHSEYFDNALTAGFDDVIEKTAFISDLPRHISKFLGEDGTK
jgi:CheY-like chemotaxis protein